jgi:SAM-dependent methyltransferase
LTQPRLLDIGCGTGLFLHLAAEAGMQVHGIELSASAVDYARTNYGLDVHHGTLEDAEIAPASCNIVVMWHVLEHLPDPVAGLRQVAELLAPGGLLFAAVPNFGSYEARLFGRRWYSLDAPRHLFHFTPQTLAAAVEQAGLQVQAITHSTGTAGLVYSLMGDLTGISLKLRHRPLSGSAYQRTAAILHALAKPPCRLAARLHHGGALELQAIKPAETPRP